MSENNNIETIDVPKEAFLYTLFEVAMEGEFNLEIPEECTDQFFNEFQPETVEEIEIITDDSMSIRGTVIVREVVDYYPASGPRGQPPINPPEYVYEERELMYDIYYYMDGLGHCETRVEMI